MTLKERVLQFRKENPDAPLNTINDLLEKGISLEEMREGTNLSMESLKNLADKGRTYDILTATDEEYEIDRKVGQWWITTKAIPTIDALINGPASDK